MPTDNANDIWALLAIDVAFGHIYTTLFSTQSYSSVEISSMFRSNSARFSCNGNKIQMKCVLLRCCWAWAGGARATKVCLHRSKH